jgi:hypothetical protein
MLFVANFAASKLAEGLAPRELGHAIVEIKEMTLSLVFAMIALSLAVAEAKIAVVTACGRSRLR